MTNGSRTNNSALESAQVILKDTQGNMQNFIYSSGLASVKFVRNYSELSTV